MPVRIDSKIKSASVVQNKAEQGAADSGMAPLPKPSETKSNVVQMHEAFERPESLHGCSIKLKNPMLEHAMYLTINHIVLNEGTPHESLRPFEVFINTKDPNSQPWIVALTRMISAAWRKGGDFAFVIDELKAVHDPRGGFFLPGGVLVPSVIAHIGLAIEQHLESIGALRRPELSPEVKAMIEAKKEQLSQKTGEPQSSAIPGAAPCPKCLANALVIMDGCSTCVECGYSKCG